MQCRPPPCRTSDAHATLDLTRNRDISAAVAEAVQPLHNATLAIDATACSLEPDQDLKLAAFLRQPGDELLHAGSNFQRRPLGWTLIRDAEASGAMHDMEQPGSGRRLRQTGPGGERATGRVVAGTRSDANWIILADLPLPPQLAQDLPPPPSFPGEHFLVQYSHALESYVRMAGASY